MNQDTLVRWLRRQFFKQRPELGLCTRLDVFHVAAGRRVGESIQSLDVGGPVDENRLEEIAAEIVNAAQDDCDGVGGLQQYVIHAFYEQRPQEHQGRHVFSLRSADAASSEDDRIETESPTKTGVLHMFMRHTENLMHGNVTAMTRVVDTLQRQNAKLAETVEALTTEKMETMQLIEALMTHDHERKLEEARVKSEIKKSEDNYQMLRTLAPVVLNKLAIGAGLNPGNLFPESATAMEIAFTTLAESITPEQFHAICGHLNGPQKIAFTDYFTEVHRKIAAREQAAQQAAQQALAASTAGASSPDSPPDLPAPPPLTP
jgi:hypothetical protein